MTPILQSESTECGLACLAMVAQQYGASWTLAELRRQSAVGRHGLDLRQMVALAGRMGLQSRPLRVDLEDLSQLQLPCILHWDFNHFVVLTDVRRGHVVLMDPGLGRRRLPVAELSGHFTGVVLECRPGPDFSPRPPESRVSLWRVARRMRGLAPTLLRIGALALVLEALLILSPLYGQMVIDDVLVSGDADLLSVLALGFGLLLLVQVGLSWLRSWFIALLGRDVGLQWMTHVFSHLMRLPASFFERRSLGDISSRFASVGTIQRAVTSGAVETAVDGLMAATALVMLLLYAPTLAMVSVGALLLYALMRWATYTPLRDASAEHLALEARESTHFLETLRSIVPLQLAGRTAERGMAWQQLRVGTHNRELRLARLGLDLAAARQLLFGVENLLVLFLGARLILASSTTAAAAPSAATFTVGMLMACMAYKQQFLSRTCALIDHLAGYRMLGLHTERLADIVLEPPEEASEPPESDLSHLPASLELCNVGFRYSDGEPWVLRGLNLRIEPGQSVAITGPSGCGKTTLLKLALGLLKPSEGQVLYGGVPIGQLGLANYRRQLAAVLQDDALLSGTLAENIAFFDPQPDLQRVARCALWARLHEDVMRMPLGYQTLVGDLGHGLSGGQRQRLLLARALYRQPRLLALDEATSHLDVANEREINAAVRGLQLTRLIIAHRPETIASADRVVDLAALQGTADKTGAAGPAARLSA